MGKHSGKSGDVWDSNATPQDKADNFDQYDEQITTEPTPYPAIANYEAQQKAKDSK